MERLLYEAERTIKMQVNRIDEMVATEKRHTEHLQKLEAEVSYLNRQLEGSAKKEDLDMLAEAVVKMEAQRDALQEALKMAMQIMAGKEVSLDYEEVTPR